MPSKIVRWINDRWPLNTVIRWSLDEEMPGGAGFAYVFGSCVLLIFLLQVVTGVWQLLYFVPAVDRGYDSLNYMRVEVPFGWLIHGLHYWGASAMIVLVGLHLSQAFIWGAYKHPRQLTWLIGVAQLLITLALGFTGPVLPWDERGYWEVEVGSGFAGIVPYLGSIAKRLLQGGASLGQMTLSRFFFLHIAILPGILITMIALHLVAFRHSGISGPWNEAKRKHIGHFWPDQIFLDALAIASIFVILVGLAAYVRAPFSGPLDLMQTFYVPKPEWYFLFLYQSLKAFPGRLEPVGTIGIPLIVILLLIFLPFIDRSPERNPIRRPVAIICYLIFVTWVITMAITGYFSKPAASTAATKAAPVVEPQTIPLFAASPSSEISESSKRGAQLINSLGCIGCHRVNGKGGVIGPELSADVLRGKSPQWLTTQIQDPKAHYPNSIMPSFSSLSDRQINDTVDFLLTLAQGKHAPPGPAVAGPTPAPSSVSPSGPARVKVLGPQAPPGPASYIIGNVDLGEYLFKQNCEQCHGIQGKDKVPNPGSTDGTVPPLNPIDPTLYDKNAQTFVNRIDPYIQHGSIPAGPNPVLHMLPFGDSKSLTQQMIANVEAYVLHLNGANRAQLVHPGMKPHLFFWLVVIVFGCALGGFWVWKGRAR